MTLNTEHFERFFIFFSIVLILTRIRVLNILLEKHIQENLQQYETFS